MKKIFSRLLFYACKAFVFCVVSVLVVWLLHSCSIPVHADEYSDMNDEFYASTVEGQASGLISGFLGSSLGAAVVSNWSSYGPEEQAIIATELGIVGSYAITTIKQVTAPAEFDRSTMFQGQTTIFSFYNVTDSNAGNVDPPDYIGIQPVTCEYGTQGVFFNVGSSIRTGGRMAGTLNTDYRASAYNYSGYQGFDLTQITSSGNPRLYNSDFFDPSGYISGTFGGGQTLGVAFNNRDSGYSNLSKQGNYGARYSNDYVYFSMPALKQYVEVSIPDMDSTDPDAVLAAVYDDLVADYGQSTVDSVWQDFVFDDSPSEEPTADWPSWIYPGTAQLSTEHYEIDYNTSVEEPWVELESEAALPANTLRLIGGGATRMTELLRDTGLFPIFIFCLIFSIVIGFLLF